MAMRIGEHYSTDKVTLRDFEKLADDAKLTKPLVRARLAEATERVLAALPKVPVISPVAEKVSDLIRRRAEVALAEFRRR